MRARTVLMLFMAAFVAGCVSAEEQRALDEAKCQSYGFTERNDAFAECLQRIELDRRAEFRSRKAFDDWNGRLSSIAPSSSRRSPDRCRAATQQRIRIGKLVLAMAQFEA